MLFRIVGGFTPGGFSNSDGDADSSSADGDTSTLPGCAPPDDTDPECGVEWLVCEPLTSLDSLLTKFCTSLIGTCSRLDVVPCLGSKHHNVPMTVSSDERTRNSTTVSWLKAVCVVDSDIPGRFVAIKLVSLEPDLESDAVRVCAVLVCSFPQPPRKSPGRLNHAARCSDMARCSPLENRANNCLWRLPLALADPFSTSLELS